MKGLDIDREQNLTILIQIRYVKLSYHACVSVKGNENTKKKIVSRCVVKNTELTYTVDTLKKKKHFG